MRIRAVYDAVRRHRRKQAVPDLAGVTQVARRTDLHCSTEPLSFLWVEYTCRFREFVEFHSKVKENWHVLEVPLPALPRKRLNLFGSAFSPKLRDERTRLLSEYLEIVCKCTVGRADVVDAAAARAYSALFVVVLGLQTIRRSPSRISCGNSSA